MRKTIVALLVGVLLVLGVVATQMASIGAKLILHPWRRPLVTDPPPRFAAVSLRGDGVNLEGWRAEAEGRRRGTLIYLHGIADHRASGAGVLERFRQRGFDVLGYDSRAHGASGGEACTYGFFEKEDLRAVLNTVSSGPIILVGSSLGGAVALQLAATDKRVSAVVAAESFSDLRSIVVERAPFFLRSVTIERALRMAEVQGRFSVDAVSAVAAARQITVPALIIHGAHDADTRPEHAQRIFAALAGPKRLILVPHARHNESLKDGAIWEEIEQWVEAVVSGQRR